MSRRVQVTCQLREGPFIPKDCKNSRGMMYRAPSSTRLRVKINRAAKVTIRSAACRSLRTTSFTIGLFEANEVSGWRENKSVRVMPPAPENGVRKRSSSRF